MLYSNDKIFFELEPGDYYMVIKSKPNGFFYFSTNLYETKTFKALFGFSRADGKFFEAFNSEIVNFQQEKCQSDFLDDISVRIGNYSYCPKLILNDNLTESS